MKPSHVHPRQRLEITLDIFRGCGHSCAGCLIDKELGGDASDIPALFSLVKEMVAVGYVPFDMGIGPTDYMTANNTSDVMEHPTFREMGELFEKVTFNAAFLEKDLSKYQSMCEDIDKALPGKPIRFLIPAAPSFFKTPKFGMGVSKRLEYVRAHLNSAVLDEAGFVINCTAGTVTDDFDDLMLKGMSVDFTVDKDDILNIPYGRLKVKDLMAGQQITRMSHRITQFYSTLDGRDERHRNPDLCHDTGTMANLVYTGGKLYWVPFLKDDCAFIDDAFEIPKPWTMAQYMTIRQTASESSMDYLKDTPCASCVNLTSCAEKGITSIMERMSIRHCLVGLEHVKTVS